MITLALFVIAQCSGSACPNPCTNCTFDPVSGTNSSVPDLQSLFATIAQRQGAADLPDVDTIETGPTRTRTAAEFPCRLLPAIGATESSILEFCEATNLTVISFDCGFGIMQVTSGAASYPGIEAREDINIAAGADILAQKWNGNENFGGHFGDSDPSIIESWYFATWAYNGFVFSNNPNNPDKPANRPPFHGPGALSRGSYPYQELVWGFLEFPLVKDGTAMWESLPVSYPDNVPNQSGLFNVTLDLPEPSHTDPCVDDCVDCPPPELRTLFLDDLDASFTVTGAVQQHTTGGFRDHFVSAPVAAVGDVLAHFEGTAPSTGLFDVAAFIPLDPATCEDVRSTVRALGVDTALTQNQNVNGGVFVNLGQAILEEGQPVVIEVTNESSDTDPSHRLGIDAFRLTWRENAEPPVGEGEGDTGEGEGDEGEGDEGEGDDGEGEGEPPPLVAIPPGPTTGGCTCATTTPADVGALVALALVVRRRRRA